MKLVAGLFPRMRGTHLRRDSAAGDVRFIPAGAGNTSAASTTSSRSTAYPRWRGEHSHTVRDSSSALGLSPLARGTPQWVITELVILRFIPAGAWNTSLENASSAAYPVYPRWRGEHASEKLETPEKSGLSPLARGTLVMRTQQDITSRFIPAGAGNTPYRTTSPVASAVYPRWRGEHIERAAKESELFGLSPLARGTLRKEPAHSLNRRFIPAGAGNTSSSYRCRGFSTVYPRWRGEHTAPGRNAPRLSGLSPLARGTHGPRQPSGKTTRFIPAGAGNTLYPAAR